MADILKIKMPDWFYKYYEAVRFLYVLVMIVCFCAFSIPRIPTHGSFGNAIYVILLAVGAVFVAAEVLFVRTFSKLPFSVLYIIFAAYSLLALYMNRDLGLMSGLKEIVRMSVIVMIPGAFISTESKETLFAKLKAIAIVYGTIWFAAVAVSIWQFLTGYGGWAQIYGDLWKIEGFYESRLFGVFGDPNFAAVGSIFAIALMAFCIYTNKKHKWPIAFYVINIIFQFIYIVLSGSRMAEVELVLLAVICGGWAAANRFSKGKKGRFAAALVIGALVSVFVVLGAYQVTQKLMSYAPAVFETAEEKIVSDKQAGETENAALERVSFVRDDVENKEDISNNRFKIWSDYIELVKTRPLFGAGAQNYQAAMQKYFPDSYVVEKEYQVHNGYLSLFVGSGIPGGLIMLAWALLLLIKMLKYIFAKRRDGYYRTVFILFLILVAGAASAMFVQMIFFSSNIVDVMFWLLLGFMFCLINKSDEEEKERLAASGCNGGWEDGPDSPEKIAEC